MKNKAFTTIELLITLGILALVSTIVVLIINPVQLVAQSRDAQRISDLKRIDTAIQLSRNSLDETLNETLVEANIVYVSLPDTDNNDLCNEYTLPTLTSGWFYRCMAPNSDLRNINNSGWIPINFTSVTTNPLISLPVDPINTATGGYYAYTQSGLATALQSNKYISEVASTDGGTQTNYFETAPITWIGSGGGPGVLFAGTDDSIYRCDASTSCDQLADWVDVTGASFPATTDFAYDPGNNIMYACTAGDQVYRCNLSTNCDARAEWTAVFSSGGAAFYSLFFDPATSAVYAGTESPPNLYRCPVSTGCDAAGEWSLVLTGTQLVIDTITRDTTNNVLYAVDRSYFSSSDDSRILRCMASTGCDQAVDWTVIDLTNQTNVTDIKFDSVNGVLYAAGYDMTGGELRRCVVSTGCDVVGEWTTPYAVAATNFATVGLTGSNLYIGEYPQLVNNVYMIYCPLSSSCDQSTDFPAHYLLESNNMSSTAITYDSANGVLYAGDGGSDLDLATASILRCLVSSGCDATGDWTSIMYGPDITLISIFYKP